MADLLETADGVMARFLKDPQSSRAALAFMGGAPLAAAQGQEEEGSRE